MVAAFVDDSYGQPTSIDVSQSESVNVVKRVVESGADGWTGTFDNTFKYQTTVDDWADWDMIEDTDADTSQLRLVDGALEGYYTIDAANIINIGAVGKCFLSINISKIAPPGTTITPQIDVMNENDAYAGWVNLDEGKPYTGKAFNWRLKLTRTSTSLTPAVPLFEFQVDMPDVTEHKTAITVNGLTTITRERTYHDIPVTIPTINDAQEGDIVIKENATLTSVDIGVKNNGQWVSRSIGYFMRGY
jgi:hypothetical protein